MTPQMRAQADWLADTARDALRPGQAAGGGDLAAVVHRAFHEAWTLAEPLNLYADSPIWTHVAAAVLDRLADHGATGDGQAAVKALDDTTADDGGRDSGGETGGVG